MKQAKNTTGFEPHTLSKEINANVVVDDRLKNRSITGGYVAWPAEQKEATSLNLLQKAAAWFKMVKPGSNNNVFIG